MIPVRRHHGFQAFASAMVIAFLASAASGSTVVDAVDEPASSRLEHASLEGDDRLSIWSPEALAARHERMRYAVDRPEPEILPSERAWMEQALELANTDDIEGAVDLIERSRADDGSAMVDFLLGTFLYGMGRLDEAADSLERAVGKAPAFRRAWMQLGLARIQEGRFELAGAALAEAIGLGAHDTTTSGLLAFARNNTGDLMAAEEAYRRTVLLDADTLDWKRGLILVFFSSGRYAEASALLGRLIREEPDNPDWWMFQANAFLGMGRPSEASRNFEVLVQLGAATPESLSMLANIYVNDGLAGLAAERYLAALQASETPDPSTAFQAAELMLRRGELAEAAVLLDGIRACCFGGFDRERRKRLLKLSARLAVLDRDAEREADVLEQLVALDPGDGESMILLGEYHGRRSDGEAEAAAWYEKAAAIPEHAARADFQHGRLLARTGRLAEAIPYLDRSLEAEDRGAVREYRDQIADYLRRTSGN